MLLPTGQFSAFRAADPAFGHDIAAVPVGSFGEITVTVGSFKEPKEVRLRVNEPALLIQQEAVDSWSLQHQLETVPFQHGLNEYNWACPSASLS